MGDIHNKFKDLVESVENGLYKKVFNNDVDLDVLTFENVLNFFVKERRRVEGAKKCLIAVDRENKFKSNDKITNDRLVVRQILLDEDENPIYKTENSYYGRILTVDDLDDELIDYMGGKNKKIMNI